MSNGVGWRWSKKSIVDVVSIQDRVKDKRRLVLRQGLKSRIAEVAINSRCREEMGLSDILDR